MKINAAVSAIEKKGILLVYPIDNRKEPPSLWSSFFPRSQMRWEWDTGGDHRVADLWRLREELSRSGRVVYAKWYRGRATFFSREVFVSMLAWLDAAHAWQNLSPQARQILEILEMDSPLSTKQIKLLTELRGKAFESVYEKALKELWSRLLIVGFGEIDDGAFPSLAVGSTRLLFEDLWENSREIPKNEAGAALARKLPPDSLFLKYLFGLAAKAPEEGSGHLGLIG